MPRKRRITAILAGSLVLGYAGSNWAQGPGNQPRLVLQALDTDHDGQLSAAEIKAAPQSLLTLDRNRDGQLTSDELSPRPENAGASPDELVQRLMAFDKNGDGVLTPDELPARMQSLFERGDTNHDGKLTPEEIRTMAERQGMPAGANGGEHGGGGRMQMDPLLAALDTDHDGVISAQEIAVSSTSLLVLDKNGDGVIEAEEMRVRQQSPEQRVEHILGEFDTNRDGKLSKAECPDRMQQQFEKMDTNGDGFLDKDELLAYFKTMSDGPRGGRAGGDHGPGEQKEQNQ
ncbi:EF-hand domain-containing protein [Silvibacterium dinghuense]|uniref:EF-hand domain-containing protein n=1 Tax=Silvibacterium dinghuense TaxID=1560006 RepID=A0A4Q1SI04_9BACT|nr:EF-hand domain-containing protein [Silvibacterium dinghuense]RXS96820.1 hypothetical protein ESZ00_02405 [Silvibacterium dinghuense]GGG93908.1 hypothetical protein GCM10011586_05890 [Silvibacterium dinghuense]